MTIQFLSHVTRSANQFQADFNVADYRGAPFLVLKVSEPGGSWTTDTLASIQTLVPNTQFRVTTTNAGTHALYRIKSN
jgi:hypothetical protein